MLKLKKKKSSLTIISLFKIKKSHFCFFFLSFYRIDFFLIKQCVVTCSLIDVESKKEGGGAGLKRQTLDEDVR